VRGAEDFTRLGGTIDDAPGEAFDKTARILGLPQPGGPAVEREAASGDPGAFGLPRPLLDRPGCDAQKSRRALEIYLEEAPQEPIFSVAGGVAANRAIRARLEAVAQEAGARFLAPPLALCTDNAAMIAWAGIERFRLGRRDDLMLQARPRWPLDERRPGMLGGGKKGAKA